MKKTLAEEQYKGISIKVVNKILPKGNIVEATAFLRGKSITEKATTKELAVSKLKKWLDEVR